MNSKDIEFLSFLQDQMEVRESNEKGKIGRDERCTTEYFILSMCWDEYLKTHLGIFGMDVQERKECWRLIKAHRDLMKK